MESKKITFTVNSNKIELELPHSIETLNDFCSFIKTQAKLTAKDLEVFVKVTENEPVLLTQANFNDLIINSDKQEISLLIIENNDEEGFEYVVPEEGDEDNVEKEDNTKRLVGNCIKCNGHFKSVKYVCCICDNSAYFCPKCEPLHSHPMVKFKDEETFNGDVLKLAKLIISTQDKNILKTLLTKKEIELSTDLKHPWPIKLGEPVSLLVNVKWYGYSPRQYHLMIKNYSDLEIATQQNDYSKEGNFSIFDRSEIVFQVTPPKEQCKPVADYCIVVFYYNSSNERLSNSVELKLVVNEKEYDDCKELNLFFKNYPEMYYLPRKKKEIIKQVFTEKLSSKTLVEIFTILKRHKFEIAQAITDLTK